MYDSRNLPLDRKKIIKKTLGYSLAYIVFFVFGGLIVFIGESIMRTHQAVTVIIGILIAVLPLAGCYLYQLWYYKLYSYEFGENGGEISKGVISRATGHVQYSRIQNIYVDQDFLDRIFGLYDVHYETAGETSGVYSHVDGLNMENANKLVAFLRHKVNPNTPLDANLNGDFALKNSDVRISRKTAPVQKRLIVAQTLSGKFFYAVFAIVVTAGRINMEDNYSIETIALWTLVIIVLAGLGLLIYNSIWFRHFNFELSDTSLVVSYQVISKSQDYISYDRIQNITTRQSFIERLLGIHSVIIETAAGGKNDPHVVLSGLAEKDAQHIRKFLTEKTEAYRNRI